MITPQLNINGSSAADLIGARLDAMANLDRAIEALSHVTPNGRDYPGNVVACTADREEHYDRLNLIAAIRESIYAEAIAIKQQQENEA